MPKRMICLDERIKQTTEKLTEYRIAYAVIEWLKDNGYLDFCDDPQELAASFAQLDDEAMYQACKIVRGR